MSGRGTVAPRDPESRASARHERSLPSLSPTAGWLRSAKDELPKKREGESWAGGEEGKGGCDGIRGGGGGGGGEGEQESERVGAVQRNGRRDIAREGGEEKILGNIVDLEGINGGD